MVCVVCACFWLSSGGVGGGHDSAGLRDGAAGVDGTLWAVATATNELGGGGWLVPFVTLLFGYYINLVPYELIVRSKFVYHYVPALLHGVLLLVVVADAALAWAALPDGVTRPSVVHLLRWRVAAVLWHHRVLAVRLWLGGVFAGVGVGFWYWGLPYAYGMPLTPEEHAARHWLAKW